MTGGAGSQRTERIVKCPTCGADTVFAPRNPYRPFCSARCKGLDLGAWASEHFRVPDSTSAADDLFDDSTPQ